MIPAFDGIRALGFGAVLVKMLGACLCGALIGLERSAKNRAAGFRTHILVCMGGAMAALTSLYIYMEMKIPRISPASTGRSSPGWASSELGPSSSPSA